MACDRVALTSFLDFVSHKLGMAPPAVQLADKRPELILAFLDPLEQGRSIAIRSRNLRLTALRAFLKFDVRVAVFVGSAFHTQDKRTLRPR